MAAIMTICAVTMHLATIWKGAKTVQSVLYPMNPIESIHEIPLYNLHHQVVAMQVEFRTKNGWVYCFCFDIHDQGVRNERWERVRGREEREERVRGDDEEGRLRDWEVRR